MNYKVKCPHCRNFVFNNKPNCTNCGLLLNKIKDCKCDYCKRPIRKYESLLKASLMNWYEIQCKFSFDEANMYSDRVINDLETDKIN